MDCIGAFDVVEHIFNAPDVLGEVHRVLRPGGFAIVTIPAFLMLWGDEDDVAGHYRRYKKSNLVALFESRGFTTLHTEYLYANLGLPAALTRVLPYRLGRRRSEATVLASLRWQLEVPSLIDRVARGILAAEALVARRVSLPLGLAILGAFRRI